MRAWLLVPCCLVALIPLAAQSPQQQPTFRSRVDVVTLDVHAVDGSGRPIADLRPDDFGVTVDGKPRSIVAADYIAYPAPVTTPAVKPEQPRPLFTTNRIGPASRPGRWILLVVDEENILAGSARHAADAAARFLDQLQPTDRVGLLVIPKSGVHIDPTTDRAAVKEALQHIVGHMIPVETRYPTATAVALADAFVIAFEQPGSIRCQQLQEKYSNPPPCGTTSGYIWELVTDARERTLGSVRALLGLLQGIASVPGPKTIVLVSQEMPVSNVLGQQADFNAEVSRLTPAAARAQASFYILHLDRPLVDVEQMVRPGDTAADADIRTLGLETVTSVTGGKRMMVSGKPEVAMDRIALEISGYYLLGFRAEAADRDGKPHGIKVNVKRPGVELRARPMFNYADEPAKAIDATATDVVSRLLGTPDTATELPLSVTTYALPEPGNQAQVRLLIAAEISRLDVREAPTTVGYVIRDANGKNVGANIEQMALKAAPSDPNHLLRYLAAAVVPAGRYTIRVAAADVDSRTGSVEHPFDARLTSAGPLGLGDLVVFDRYPDQSGKPHPSVSADVSGAMNGYLEAFSPAGPPPDVTGRLEMADSATAPARVTAPMAAQPATPAGRVQFSGSVDVTNLPEGAYVARAVVLAAGKVVGQVVRPVRVIATPPPAPPAAAPPAQPEPTAPTAAAELRPAAAPRAEAAGARSYGAVARTVDDLMDRAGAYCLEYADEMSLVIGVERYAQWMQTDDATRPVTRMLVSEFALVRTKDDWDGLRDVYEVDSRPVPDRKDRLLKLFTESPGSAVEQSRKIASESARYNLGAMQRNFNVPTTALFFLKPENQARFRFKKDSEDQIDGVTVWAVKYEETRTPTIIRTSQGKDMPVHGTLWIDPVQGRVLRTHMEITSEAMLTADHGGMSVPTAGSTAQTRWGDNRRVRTSASITVSYKLEPNLGLLVPAEMRETYEGPARSAFTGNETVSRINCRATYSEFKRFETGARIVVK